MSIKSFLKLVEIQTKVASMIPFLLGTLYAGYRFQQFDARNFLLMLISLLCFDMATTAINNYMDYKKAKKTHGYGYEIHNAIVQYKMRETHVQITIGALLLTAFAFGFFLFLNTNLVVLVVGAVSFLAGILYTSGPIPISRMPLGEVFSGIFMGFVIIFASAYVHVYDQQLVTLSYQQGLLGIGIQALEMLYIVLLSIPGIHGIANIMLANNICDMEEDLENKRYTLPIYIGKEKALVLFKWLYYVGYGAIILLIALQIIPVWALFVLASIIPVEKNIQIFMEKQTKKDTFICAVKNFVLINGTYIVAMGLAVIVNYWL